jgi:hypothetical protein
MISTPNNMDSTCRETRQNTDQQVAIPRSINSAGLAESLSWQPKALKLRSRNHDKDLNQSVEAQIPALKTTKAIAANHAKYDSFPIKPEKHAISDIKNCALIVNLRLLISSDKAERVAPIKDCPLTSLCSPENTRSPARD